MNTISDSDHSPIVFYHYFDMADSDFFCSSLEKRFRESGHTRPIVFKEWNCYQELPGKDGDLFSYDAAALSALVNKGYLHQLPDVIPTDDIFTWILDRTKARKKTYGVPIMLCFNALICRKEDDREIRNVYELDEKVAIPLRSMLMYYYIQSFCNYQDRSGSSFKTMKLLKDLMLGKENPVESWLRTYDGVAKFKQGECRYFLGFTESMRFFDKGDYVVRLANFSDYEEDQMPMFMADLISMGKNIREEKLLDCLDLIEIMVDPQFIYELCTQDGQLQYMLPADRRLYPMLAELDPIYQQFYSILDSDENGVIRYGTHFYEDFNQIGDELMQDLIEDRILPRRQGSSLFSRGESSNGNSD